MCLLIENIITQVYKQKIYNEKRKTEKKHLIKKTKKSGTKQMDKKEKKKQLWCQKIGHSFDAMSPIFMKESFLTANHLFLYFCKIVQGHTSFKQ